MQTQKPVSISAHPVPSSQSLRSLRIVFSGYMPHGYHRNKLYNLQIDQYTESLYKYFCINRILDVLVVFLFRTLCCRGAAGGWVEFVSVLELLLSPLTHLQRVWVNQHLLKYPDHQSARCLMIFRQ